MACYEWINRGRHRELDEQFAFVSEAGVYGNRTH